MTTLTTPGVRNFSVEVDRDGRVSYLMFNDEYSFELSELELLVKRLLAVGLCFNCGTFDGAHSPDCDVRPGNPRLGFVYD